jgi:hypothetical protein
MEILYSTTTEWTSEDMSVFRQFLQTRTGSKLLPKLLENTPIPLKSGTELEILIRSGELAAWRDVALAFVALANPVPEVDEDIHRQNYPDLDDDSKWKDTDTNAK